MSSTSAQYSREPMGHRLCRMGQRYLPWVVSVFFHLGVIVLLSFIVLVIARPRPQLQVGLADVTGYVVVPPGGPRFDISRRSQKIPGERASGASGAWVIWDAKHILTSEDDSQLPTGGRVSLGRRGETGEGADEKDLGMGSGGGAGKGLTDGPGGDKGKLTRVVYLLDASGSMLESFEFVKRRLYMELGYLRFGKGNGWNDGDERKQYFNIVFFRTKSQACWPTLMPATDANKRAAVQWARPITAAGETDPISAMRIAFGYDPEQIVVLSDGEFSSKALKIVAQLQNRRSKPVRIIAIAYGKGLGGENLRRLAETSGGRFLRITDE